MTLVSTYLPYLGKGFKYIRDAYILACIHRNIKMMSYLVIFGLPCPIVLIDWCFYKYRMHMHIPIGCICIHLDVKFIVMFTRSRDRQGLFFSHIKGGSWYFYSWSYLANTTFPSHTLMISWYPRTTNFAPAHMSLCAVNEFWIRCTAVSNLIWVLFKLNMSVTECRKGQSRTQTRKDWAGTQHLAKNVWKGETLNRWPAYWDFLLACSVSDHIHLHVH